MSRSKGQLKVPHRYRRVSRRDDWRDRFKTKKEISIEPISLDEIYVEDDYELGKLKVVEFDGD